MRFKLNNLQILKMNEKDIENLTLESYEKDRKSVVQGKSVDLGGRRIIKKKKKTEKKRKNIQMQ